MSPQFQFHGPNEGYVLELYERYLQEPESLDSKTRAFFANWSPPATNGLAAPVVGAAPESAASVVDMRKVVGAVSYAQAIRQFGHVEARLDPLGMPSVGDPELVPEAHGITDEDLKALPPGLLVDGPLAHQSENAYEVIQTLREIYASSIGYDNDHVRIPEERQWLREAIESRRYRYEPSRENNEKLLKRLTQVEIFEQFLQRSFPTKYRFSVEGLDMMIPVMDEIVMHSVEAGIEVVAVAMAHRGRLNVLAHVMEKPYAQILADFKDPLEIQEMQDAIGWTVDDVKYHKAWQHAVSRAEGQSLTLTMPPNPSHLEAVNPVAVGMARAAGTSADQKGEAHFDPRKTMQILIHGDAAFPGQGIVAETFNLNSLPGYWTGGTIHIIANNQIGFTTMPRDGRSTLYASDLAKGFKVPIVHVNADDPAACMEVARMAFAYQEEFEKDFLIDLIGYRRYGHNELDEPGFTQPKMYDLVRSHKTVRKLWTENLIRRGHTTEEEADALVKEFEAHLQDVIDNLKPSPDMIEQRETPEPGAARRVETAITPERLMAINDGLTGTYEGFNFYSTRFEKTIRKRRTALNDPDVREIDWATAEELAFASILEDGTPIRMTGQDTERGTFSHRHAVLYDAQTGERLTPLQKLPQAQAAFEIRNSPLSEAAVLGFEYGYSIQAPGRLVLWEAQYGDFNNGAQTIIDEFIVSAREKWGQTPSLVLLLPHGHEGAGPDHSSARLERFLQMAAKTNIRIVNCTTAGQYFHLLRRQALLLKSDPLPLVVMAPKSLLRNPDVAVSMKDVVTGSRWQPVLDDTDADPEKVTRLVFCSGKFYYDLVGSEFRAERPDVAIVRVEQLYPFPAPDLREVIEKYPNAAQIVWAQEEPKNMGAWEFMGYRLKKLVGIQTPVNYVGRRRSSSPAEGSKTAYTVNQAMIVDYTFNWKFR